MLKEFREFVLRGNVVDLAVAVIVGGAFGKIVTSLVNDILMPPIGLILGHVDFSNLFVTLGRHRYDSLAAAKAAGAPTINYGIFLNAAIDFVIVAFAMFVLIRQVSRIQKPAAAPAAPSTKPCAYCCTEVPLKAVRCPYCTSELSTS